MANTPSSSQTTALPLDNSVDEDFSVEENMTMLITSYKVLQGLNKSRSELLSRVQSLKQDLQGTLDTEVNSYNEEFLEMRNMLKEQLAVTTSKLAELDTSVVDCVKYLEDLNVNCELEKPLFDDLIADLWTSAQ